MKISILCTQHNSNEMPSRKKSSDEAAELPKPPAWGTSHAKELLLDDIRDGIWKRGDPPRAVWLSREEFQKYKQSNFGQNFRAACDQLAAAQARAKTDAAAVVNDRKIHPRSDTTFYGYPRWDGSKASHLLVQDLNDMADGTLETMKPKALQETREEYLAFPLDVFRDHIKQIRRKQVEGEYWNEFWHQKKLRKQGLL
jgi:hypothetical protein